MTRAALLAPLLAGACATAQSARVLPPGRTDVTIAAGRLAVVESPDPDDDESSRWFGHVTVRRGLAPRLDAAVVLARTPGTIASTTFFAVEPKVELTPRRARVVISASLLTGLAWSEFVLPAEINPRRVFDREAYVLAPTAHVGVDLSPGVELVAAPRFYLFLPARPDDALDTGLGGALGARLRGAGGAWVVHPELTVTSGHGATVLALIVALSAGR